MEPVHAAHNCRWAQPRMYVPLPGWMAIWRSSWECVGDDGSRLVLDARNDCAICARWMERSPEEKEWIFTQAAL